MGGKSTSKTESQQTQEQNPWAPAIPGLTDLTKAVSSQVGNAGLSQASSGALDTLQRNANAGNPYAPQIGMLADNMLRGGTDLNGTVNDAYLQYQRRLNPYADGHNLDPTQAPGMANLLSTIRGDVGNSVNSMFAGAGRDLSGKHVEALSRGISAGEAAPLLGQYNQNVQNQLGAADALYGAGGQTAGLLSGLARTGIDFGKEALDAKNYGANSTLAIEAQRLGIPLQQYAQIAGILGPLGQMGGTAKASGTSNTTNHMAGADRFYKIATPITSMFRFGGG